MSQYRSDVAGLCFSPTPTGGYAAGLCFSPVLTVDCFSPALTCGYAAGGFETAVPFELGQPPVHPLELLDPVLQRAGHLAELLHGADVLHEDTLL